jgi:beta-lactamase regulating signal transducer with metallopeptidase domain
MDASSRLVVTYLANVLWQTPVILGIAVLCSKLIRRSPWSHRHILWVAVLVLSVLLPFWSLGSLAQNRVWPIPLGAPVVWIVVGLYAQFLLLRLIVLCSSWRHTDRLLRAAYLRSVPGPLVAIVESCAIAWAMHDIPVLGSRELQGPATLGFRRPVLLLPERFFGGLIAETDVASAVHHELAHIRRHDYVRNVICEILYLPVSFHPAAVFIKARIDQTRELACDEMAAAKSSSRIAYAQSLLNIAQAICPASQWERSSHALALFDTDSLEERIKNLLMPSNRLHNAAARLLALCGLGLLALACLAVSRFHVRIADAVGVAPRLQISSPHSEVQTARNEADREPWSPAAPIHQFDGRTS